MGSGQNCGRLILLRGAWGVIPPLIIVVVLPPLLGVCLVASSDVVASEGVAPVILPITISIVTNVGPISCDYDSAASVVRSGIIRRPIIWSVGRVRTIAVPIIIGPIPVIACVITSAVTGISGVFIGASDKSQSRREQQRQRPEVDFRLHFIFDETTDSRIQYDRFSAADPLALRFVPNSARRSESNRALHRARRR